MNQETATRVNGVQPSFAAGATKQRPRAIKRPRINWRKLMADAQLFAKRQGKFTAEDMQKRMGLSPATSYNVLRRLKKKRVVRFVSRGVYEFSRGAVQAPGKRKIGVPRKLAGKGKRTGARTVHRQKLSATDSYPRVALLLGQLKPRSELADEIRALLRKAEDLSSLAKIFK